MRLALATCGIVLVLIPSVAGQDRAVSQVLDKAAIYVSGFERQLAGVVAEETYLQRCVLDQVHVCSGGVVRRELKSDLLLVPVASEARYVQFRDVFEVDGKAVRDREDRLTRLFQDSSPSASAQLQAIAEESARYNIGDIQRTVNTPTLALVFLRAENQQAGTFTLTNRTKPDLTSLGQLANDVPKTEWADFSVVPAGTRVLAFKEATHNTLIRRSLNRDAPSHERFWVDPATGSVFMTELTVDDGTVTAVIDVRYRPTSSVAGAMMPSEMRELYIHNSNTRWGDIFGRATYDHFRTFRVTTSTGDVKVK